MAEQRSWLERNGAIYAGLIAFAGGVGLLSSWEAGLATFLIIWGLIMAIGAMAHEAERQKGEKKKDVRDRVR